MITKKRPKLNPEILEEIFDKIKICENDAEEQPSEEYPLTNFMLSGKEAFEIALNYYNQMEEARIEQKCIVYKNYKDEEYTFYRKFAFFNLFGQRLLASVERITCCRNYPKDLPLFKHVKSLKEFTADAFYILTYSKSFSQIEFIEKVVLLTSVKDMMDIHNLPFPCNELYLKDYGYSRYMKKKLKKLINLSEDFAATTSKNLNSIKSLTIEDYIDDSDIPNLKFREIASCFSSKFQNLQSFTVIFIIFMQDNLDVIDHLTDHFVQALNDSINLLKVHFTINFNLYLLPLKQSHVDFYDSIIQDQNYQVNQEEKTAKRVISSGKCKIEILFSFV